MSEVDATEEKILQVVLSTFKDVTINDIYAQVMESESQLVYIAEVLQLLLESGRLELDGVKLKIPGRIIVHTPMSDHQVCLKSTEIGDITLHWAGNHYHVQELNGYDLQEKYSTTCFNRPIIERGLIHIWGTAHLLLRSQEQREELELAASDDGGRPTDARYFNIEATEPRRNEHLLSFERCVCMKLTTSKDEEGIKATVEFNAMRSPGFGHGGAING